MEIHVIDKFTAVQKIQNKKKVLL